MEVQVKKCIVRDCPNHNNQGVMIGDLCSPCYYTLTGQNRNSPATHRILTSILLDKKEVGR